MYEETLFHKSIDVSISVEEQVENKILHEELKDAMSKARELFNFDLKDIDINNITKYYFMIEINNKEMLVKVNNGKI